MSEPLDDATHDDPVADAADDFQALLRDPKAVVDTVVPTVLFALLASVRSTGAAATVALLWCAVVFAVRLARKERLVHAFSGLGAVGVGVAVALATGEASGFFLPGIIGNLVFGVVCVLSIVVRRPAVAYSSAALYRWPIAYYMDPRVRPAYSEITAVWAVYYLIKGWWQYQLVQSDSLGALTTVRLVLGWPGLAGLLAITYAYVKWRLERLNAPEVDAFR